MKRTMRIWLALVLALCAGTTAWADDPGYNLTTGTVPTDYTVAFTGGTDATHANAGTEVTITVTSAENKKVGEVTAKGYMTIGGMRAPRRANDIEFLSITLTEVANSRTTVDTNKEQVQYTLTMPAANVEVSVSEIIPLSSCTVTLTPDTYTWDGTAKTPTATVTYGSVTLNAETDYTVAYSNNTAAGATDAATAPTVTITAKDGTVYSGTTTKTFTINPKSIASASVTLRQGNSNVGTSTYTYDGTAKTPTAIVKDGSKTLTAGTDYTISYENNTNAGTATATIVGQGNYTGGPSETFTINKAASALTFATRSITKQYNDANFTNAVTVTKGDGTVSYRSTNTTVATIDAATGEVTIKGTGSTTIYASITAGTNYKASNNAAYYSLTVRGISLYGATFGLSQTSYEYDGNAKCPTVYNAQLGTTTLTEGTDYYVEYYNNVNAGEAVVYIIAKTGSKYQDYAYMTFTIRSVTTTNGNITVEDGGDVTTLTIQDMGNQQGKTVPENLAVTTVTYYRTLNENDKNAYTVCLPYAPPTSSDLKYYTLNDADGTTLQFNEISGAPQAYTPYLVFASATTDIGTEDLHENIVMKKEVSNSSTGGNYQLKGTLSGISHNDAVGMYILQSGNRWAIVGNDLHAYVPPFRAYIVATNNAPERLESTFDGNATSLQNIRTVDCDGTERWFDLNGRRIAVPKQGINIVNGRKVVIK